MNHTLFKSSLICESRIQDINQSVYPYKRNGVPEAIFSLSKETDRFQTARHLRQNLGIKFHADLPPSLQETLPSISLLLELDEHARNNPDSTTSDNSLGIVPIDNTPGTLWRRLMDHLGDAAPVIPPTPAEREAATIAQAAAAAAAITAARQGSVAKDLRLVPRALQRPSNQPKQGHSPN